MWCVIQIWMAGTTLSGLKALRKMSFWKIVNFYSHGFGYGSVCAFGESNISLNSSDFSKKNSSIPFMFGMVMDML